MVALAVPRFGMIVSVNLARSFLFRAHAALEAGNVFEAGVLLREAIRRQLVAECNWHDCLPQGFTERTPPRVLLESLRKAGKCGDVGYGWTKELIQIANRCAHAQHVTAGEAPPTPGLFGKCDDIDDDDHGDDWKIGGAV